MDEEILLAFEDDALWLRSQYLGTDFPDVAWQDAPESEREAWLRTAILLEAITNLENDDKKIPEWLWMLIQNAIELAGGKRKDT